jgi:hypothetical protein
MEAAGEFTEMNFLAVFGMALLSLSFTSAECVVVTPAVHPSSDRVRVTALVDGRPIKDAKLEFFFAAEATPGFVVATNGQGVGSTPRLSPGPYRVVATGPNVAAESYLQVSRTPATKPTRLGMNLVPVPIPASPLVARLAIVEKMSVTERVRLWQRLVLDPSGSAITGVEVEIVRKREGNAVAKLKSDEAGHFLAALDDGAYVAFFDMPGFRTQPLAFEIAHDANPKELEIFMLVGGC